MKRPWFVHGQWPKAYVRTHWLVLTAFLLALATGLLLYLPAVHAQLITVLPLLYDLHITFGVLLGLALLLPLAERLPRGKRIRRLDWIVVQVMLAALTMSGVVLWQIAFFPATWRSLAFTLHGDFAYVMTGWISVHFALRAFSAGALRRLPVIDRRVSWERRDFLKWSGYGLAGMFGWLLFGSALPAATRILPGPSGQVRGLPVFPAYYTVTGAYPAISEASYRLTVDGLVDRPEILTLSALKRLQSRRVTHNFQCVTGWVVPDVTWTGVSLRTIAEHVSVRPEAKYITFHSADGIYSDSLTLPQAFAADVLLAYDIDGQPLPQQQGYPLRLVVPDMYGYKSIKWVDRVTFSATREIGYWEQRGYAANAYLPT